MGKLAGGNPKFTADHRVIVFKGRELFLRSEYTAGLRLVLEKAHGQVGTVRFDGGSCTPAEVLDECRSFGLMCGHKLVIVDEADRFLNESTRPIMERYAGAPCDGATLVLRADGWRAGKLDKLIAKVGLIVSCEAPKAENAHRWCVRRAEHIHGVSIEPGAAGMLIERLGVDMARLDSELGKLATSVGVGGTIDAGLVGELVGGGHEINPFAIQDDLISGDPQRAVGMVRRVLDNAPRDAHIPAVFACVGLARRLHAVAVGCEAGRSPDEVAKRMGANPYFTRGLAGPARRLGSRRTLGLVEAALDAEVAMKSGRGRPDRVLERLAVGFSEAIHSSG